jgi:hypothetical protein
MNRGVACLAVLAAVVGGGCSTEAIDQVFDFGDPSVYEITLDYEEGHMARTAWRALFHRGAEECFSNAALETIRFRITGVPSPKPPGWDGVALSGRESCTSLIAGYPYDR